MYILFPYLELYTCLAVMTAYEAGARSKNNKAAPCASSEPPTLRYINILQNSRARGVGRPSS